MWLENVLVKLIQIVCFSSTEILVDFVLPGLLSLEQISAIDLTDPVGGLSELGS